MEVRGKEVEEPKLPSLIGFYNECDCLYVSTLILIVTGELIICVQTMIY